MALMDVVSESGVSRWRSLPGARMPEDYVRVYEACGGGASDDISRLAGYSGMPLLRLTTEATAVSVRADQEIVAAAQPDPAYRCDDAVASSPPRQPPSEPCAETHWYNGHISPRVRSVPCRFSISFVKQSSASLSA